MRSEENKRLIERMNAGDVEWLEQLAENAVWIIPGATGWSDTYNGKQEIVETLLSPLNADWNRGVHACTLFIF